MSNNSARAGAGRWSSSKLTQLLAGCWKSARGRGRHLQLGPLRARSRGPAGVRGAGSGSPAAPPARAPSAPPPRAPELRPRPCARPRPLRARARAPRGPSALPAGARLAARALFSGRAGSKAEGNSPSGVATCFVGNAGQPRMAGAALCPKLPPRESPFWYTFLVRWLG